MAEQLLDQMIQKINAITQSLEGTISQIQNMSDTINNINQKFSEETVSLTENIRLIVEVLKQFRVQSSKSLKELSDELNEKIQDLWDKNSLESIIKEEKNSIDIIRQGEKAVSNNLYYAQLLSIIRSIREETNRVLSGRRT
ncbi:MAG: hypothetical protein ACFFDO_09970 [Candidatus Thorarchaeota archaeon]